MIRKLIAAALGATTALVATSALAQNATAAPAPAAASSSSSPDEGLSVPGASVALLLGYATNNLNLALGVRGGYTLPMDTGPGHIYVGGTFIYFTGTDGITFWNLGAEGGYEIPAGPVLVRPYLGLGIVNGSGGGYSESNFATTLGGTVLYPVTPSISVGGDARYIIVSGTSAFVLAATGAYHF